MINNIFNKKNVLKFKLVLALILMLILLSGVIVFALVPPIRFSRALIILDVICLIIQVIMLPDHIRNYINFVKQEDDVGK